MKNTLSNSAYLIVTVIILVFMLLLTGPFSSYITTSVSNLFHSFNNDARDGLINSKIIGGGGEIPSIAVPGSCTITILDTNMNVISEQSVQPHSSINLSVYDVSAIGLIVTGWASTSGSIDGDIFTADESDATIYPLFESPNKSSFTFVLTPETGLTVTLQISGNKNWGDGTSDSSTSHTFPGYGTYTVVCDDTATMEAKALGQTSGNPDKALVSAIIGPNLTSNYQDSVGGLSYCSNLTNIKIFSNNVKYLCSNCENLETVQFSNVTKVSSNVCNGCANLSSVIIPGGTGTIESSAFKACANLDDVIIPDSVTRIETSAFQECSALTNVVIPNTVDTWGSSVFRDCVSLTEVTIPTNITKVPNYMFYGCTGLKSVEIPNNIERICQYAFYMCTGLEEVVLSENCKYVDSYAFYKCSNIKRYVFPYGFKEIGPYMLYGCSELESIVLPSTLTTLSQNAFKGCGKVTEIIIPDGIPEIAESTLSKMGITSIVLPASVTSIGKQAFYDTEKLASIVIEGPVTFIGNQAFRRCYALKEIILPNTVNNIDTYAFADMNNLLHMELPDGLTTIKEGLFSNGKKLLSVTIPASVTSIAAKAFEKCTKCEITYLGTIEQWEAISKSSNWNLNATEIVVHCTNGDA